MITALDRVGALGRTVVGELDETAREWLIRTAVPRKDRVRAALRARIVLAAADGLSNGATARELAVHVSTVRTWLGRFTAQGPDGLNDASRSGRPRTRRSTGGVDDATTATSAPPRTRRRPGHTGRSPQRSPAPVSPASPLPRPDESVPSAETLMMTRGCSKASGAERGSGGGAGDGARGERGQHLLQGSHEVQFERGE
ncbi:helix-turn-helix domain-containing protein [Streptomyces flaveolus]|uniref:helix-turn-helix domain-containing protein n=1 Tax=Streptomyces flaveolus TaxID=67297 RepID=UPI0033DF352C